MRAVGSGRIRGLKLAILGAFLVVSLTAAVPPGRHTDWPWPLSYIPRSWTAVESQRKPVQVLGTVGKGENLDVPKPGRFTLAWPPYFAVTGPRGIHFRIGVARYDYVDEYYQIPTVALKRIKFPPAKAELPPPAHVPYDPAPIPSVLDLTDPDSGTADLDVK
jgi:hypothetical protein